MIGQTAGGIQEDRKARTIELNRADWESAQELIATGTRPPTMTPPMSHFPYKLMAL